ncbi:MAG: DUF459 domain-containing protein [Pseudomonadota bacterium]
MALTLFAALACGVALEAEGIHTWAQRLGVGALRERALPITATLLEWTHPWHGERPRGLLLGAKSALAPAMLARLDDLAAPGAQALGAGHAASPSVADHAAPAGPAPGQASGIAAAPPALPRAVTPAPFATASEPLPATGDGATIGPAPAPMPRAPSTWPADGIDVALAGDSMMAVGLAPTLKRWFAGQKNVHVIGAYRSGTGLSRPEVFDWITEYPRMLGKARPALVICSMGANDAQNVQVGKTVLQFDTPEWDAFFRARLSAYLDVLTREKPQVLWVGMPDMRSPAFSKKMGHLNALLKTTLARYPNTTWLDPQAAMAGSPRRHGFQQFRAQQGGKLVKVRADDGIHLTDDGALYLLDPIRTWMAGAVDAGARHNRVALADLGPGGATRGATAIKAAPAGR